MGHSWGRVDDDKDDKDPGEPEHEDVTKLEHGPTFERRDHYSKKSEEPPVRTGGGDSDKGSGESKNDSSSSEGSDSSQGSPSEGSSSGGSPSGGSPSEGSAGFAKVWGAVVSTALIVGGTLGLYRLFRRIDWL